jgi:omega-amidase
LLKARAIENQAFVIGVNRVGVDGTGKDHNGYSTVVNPMGELIAEHINESGLFIYEINREEVDNFKALFNVLHDQRVIE